MSTLSANEQEELQSAALWTAYRILTDRSNETAENQLLYASGRQAIEKPVTMQEVHARLWDIMGYMLQEEIVPGTDQETQNIVRKLAENTGEEAASSRRFFLEQFDRAFEAFDHPCLKMTLVHDMTAQRPTPEEIEEFGSQAPTPGQHAYAQISFALLKAQHLCTALGKEAIEEMAQTYFQSEDGVAVLYAQIEDLPEPKKTEAQNHINQFREFIPTREANNLLWDALPALITRTWLQSYPNRADVTVGIIDYDSKGQSEGRTPSNILRHLTKDQKDKGLHSERTTLAEIIQASPDNLLECIEAYGSTTTPSVVLPMIEARAPEGSMLLTRWLVDSDSVPTLTAVQGR